MDIFATRDKIKGTRNRGSGNTSSGNLFASYFFGKSKYISSIVGTLSMMKVKKYILGLQDLVRSANKIYHSSLCAISKMIGAVTRTSEFSTANHLQAV